MLKVMSLLTVPVTIWKSHSWFMIVIIMFCRVLPSPFPYVFLRGTRVQTQNKSTSVYSTCFCFLLFLVVLFIFWFDPGSHGTWCRESNLF